MRKSDQRMLRGGEADVSDFRSVGGDYQVLGVDGCTKGVGVTEWKRTRQRTEVLGVRSVGADCFATSRKFE